MGCNSATVVPLRGMQPTLLPNPGQIADEIRLCFVAL